MAIADWDTYRSRLRAPYERVQCGTTSFGTTSGIWQSLWLRMLPTAGSIPAATPVSPAATEPGALGQRNASGVQRLARFSALTGACGGAVMVADRLVHMGGLSGAVTSPQTVGTSGLPSRAGNGDGVSAALEMYSDVGTTTTTAVVAYTNSAGASRTSPALSFGGTNLRTAGRSLRVPVASGDTGIQSVESVTLTTSTGTAGNFGVTLLKPIAMVPIALWGNQVQVFDAILDMCCNVAPIPNDACLTMYWLPFTSLGSTPNVTAELTLIED